MEERRVTVDEVASPLPEPFFVMANQKPSNQEGIFPLREPHLDRLLMMGELFYPDPIAERILVKGQYRRVLLAALETQSTC